MNSKATLRLHYKAMRTQMDAVWREGAQQAIHRHLTNENVFQQAHAIFSYCNFQSEVATLPLLELALAQGKTVAVPRLTRKKGVMEAVPLKHIGELQPGTFGIPTPPTDRPPVSQLAFDLILIPGLAFDSYGHRLGYGGGYYDRFLQREGITGFRLGLGYHFQYVEHLPHDPFDQRIDGVLTEKGLFPTKPVEDGTDID